MMDKTLLLQLLRNKPIHAHGLIYTPPSLEEIFDKIGYEQLKNLMLPFCLTKDCFDLPTEVAGTLSLFKDIILTNPIYIADIRAALEIICHEKQVEFMMDEIHIDHLLPESDRPQRIIINEDIFEEMCQIMMAVSGTAKIHIEKPPKSLSDRQLDIWQKLHEGRERERIKHTPALIDIINLCCYGGDYYISIDEIEHWNLWQLMNCYTVRVGLKDYNDCLALTPVTYDVKSISNDKHWTNRLKVRE